MYHRRWDLKCYVNFTKETKVIVARDEYQYDYLFRALSSLPCNSDTLRVTIYYQLI